MYQIKASLLLGLLLMNNEIPNNDAHARFMEPPSRASMWRLGYNNPPDYNDNEGFCGGLEKMIALNGCGICGDPLDEILPRAHESGGIYGNGLIVREYKIGQVINITIELTANHLGKFSFKLCSKDKYYENKVKYNVNMDPDQSCFDNEPLRLYPQNTLSYELSKEMIGFVSLALQLPANLSCSQCILQWTYTGGNNWGNCSNGTHQLGCGPQETYKGCSDVTIH